MSYFGEEYEKENCGHCDNCKHPKERIEAKDDAVIALKAIKALDERFATDYTVQIIVGRLTPQNQMFRHDVLDVFASGNDRDSHFWNSLIRQLILEGLLTKDIEEYGVLKFTKKGEAFLKKPKSFQIVLNKLYEDANADDEEVTETTGGAALDERLYDMLMELRQKEAKKKSSTICSFPGNIVAGYVHFYPITMEGLEKCQGVSKGKAMKYGKPFVDLIARYVEDNKIERPDDFVMKSVVNKSGSKVYIIQNTDKKFLWKR